MNTDVFDYMHRQAWIKSQDDVGVYHAAVDGLPNHGPVDDFGNPVPHSLGEHSVAPLRRFVEESKAKCLLQIGFNTGVSTAILSQLGVHKIVSVEIRDSSEVQRAADFCHFTWGHELVICDSMASFVTERIPKLPYDTAFIDGDHGIIAVRSDIELVKSVGVGSFLMDDMLPQYGTGLAAAMERDDLKMLWWDGNMAAFRFL